jgi:hypothetical protein
MGGTGVTEKTSALTLDGIEPDALAWRLIARLVSDWPEHVDWEDVPNLSEISWEQVAGEMDEIATWVSNRSDQFDRELKVDSRYLFEQATS